MTFAISGAFSLTSAKVKPTFGLGMDTVKVDLPALNTISNVFVTDSIVFTPLESTTADPFAQIVSTDMAESEVQQKRLFEIFQPAWT